MSQPSSTNSKEKKWKTHTQKKKRNKEVVKEKTTTSSKKNCHQKKKETQKKIIPGIVFSVEKKNKSELWREMK